MSKRKKALLIAEKPSLGREIKKVYEKHREEIPYDITVMDQRGHLLELLKPGDANENLKKWSWETLPFSADDIGGWKYAPIKEEKQGNYATAKEKLAAIRKECRSGKYDFIIHAGDPDQEGEILVWETLDYIGCRIPVMRFWTNDLNEGHILNALKNLRDEKNDEMLINLKNAGFCRQHADYITGLNITRAATLKFRKPGSKTPVVAGRVISTILKIVADREKEIRDFEPVTVYGVQADYEKGFSGRLFSQKNEKSGESAEDEDEKSGIVWFTGKEAAENVIKRLGSTALVTRYTKKPIITLPPKLFMLATAQVEAGKMGYKADRTLALIQSLYEKKFVTYPRTDCEYLSSGDDLEGILKAVGKVDEYAPFVRRVTGSGIEKVRHTKKWVNDEKLEKSGHSALRPTVTVPDMETLSYDEKRIYDMICRRFIAIFLPSLVQEETTIETDISGYDFVSRGKSLVDKGFTEIFENQFSDQFLPKVSENEILDVSGCIVTTKTSKCPSRYTSATLVAACESPQKYVKDENLKDMAKKIKIGTQATRAAIISRLAYLGYVEEVGSGKNVYIRPTAKGETIIDNLGGSMICRVDMTALWEEELEKVRSGELDPSMFEEKMQKSVDEMVRELKEMQAKEIEGENTANSEELVVCPICKKGTVKISHKGYYCTGINDKSCGFWIGNPLWGKKISKEQVMQLTEKGRTGVIKGFKNNGKTFNASLVVKEGRIRPEFSDGASSLVCPKCGKNLRKMSWGWGCSGYPQCRFVIGQFGGKTLTEKQVGKLLDGSEVSLKGLISKKNPDSTYSAAVKFDGERIVPVKFL